MKPPLISSQLNLHSDWEKACGLVLYDRDTNSCMKAISNEEIRDSCKTVHSFIINSTDYLKKNGKYKRGIVDKALMLHAGEIVFVFALAEVSQALLIGDKNQIPYINRTPYDLKYFNILEIAKVTQTLNHSYRCTSSAADFLSTCYQQGMTTSNLDSSFLLKKKRLIPVEKFHRQKENKLVHTIETDETPTKKTCLIGSYPFKVHNGPPMTARLLGKDKTFENFFTQNIEESIRLHTLFLPVPGNSDLTSPFGAETVNYLPEDHFLGQPQRSTQQTI
ncbi:hypothetical protein J6590_061490 [Homalodisca vitripennis]|nr:hypothetical protein J6590_061490 [Homalodisca vitripennis]